MASGDVTRRELNLGDLDDTTGWYEKVFTETTIKGIIRPRGASIIATVNGQTFTSLAKYPQTFFAYLIVKEGDEIIDAYDDYYVIQAVDKEKWLDQFSHYVCNAEYLEFHADRPATYGTGSAVDDSRYRNKVFIDNYVSNAAITKDNGSTHANWLSCWSGFDYPLSMVMLSSPEGKDVDGIYAISPSETTAYETYNHYAYKFREQVPITIYTVDKPGITAENLKNKMEQELRRVIGAYPTGSLRKLRAGRPVQVGVHPIYGYEYILEYTRPNDDYIPSYPTITWGPSASPTGTFVFPNVIELSPPFASKDNWDKIAAMSGDSAQALGSGSLDIEMKCDLDTEPEGLTWKRPQTSSPKTDSTKFDIFLDLLHNEGITQSYHTLKLGWGNNTGFQVRLVRATPDLINENIVTLLFREYRTTSADAQTYKQRFGM